MSEGGSGNPSPTAAAAAPGLPPGREELCRLPHEVIHPGSATKAAVTAYPESPLGPVVVKDVRPQHGLFRSLVGRRILRREARVLQALAGVAGVPRFLGWVDREAFAQELRPGVPMRGILARERPEAFRTAALGLAPMVRALHERGVVHLDLRQRRNILVDDAGGVSLIDFESALVLGHRGWQGWLLGLLSRLDRAACLKFKARYAADLLTDDEQRRWRRQQRWARLWIFHRFGPLVRRLLGSGPGGDGRPPSNTS